MAECVRPIRYTVAAIRPRHFSFERCKAARIIYATLEHGSSQSGGNLQPGGGSPNVFVALSTAPGLPLRLLHFTEPATLQLRYFKASLFYSFPILQLPYFTAALFYSLATLEPSDFTGPWTPTIPGSYKVSGSTNEKRAYICLIGLSSGC